MSPKRKKSKPLNECPRKGSLKSFFQIVCCFFPFVLYIVVTTFVCPAPNSGFLLIGALGVFLMGVSLSVLIGLGRKDHRSVFSFAVGGLAVGTVLICISSILLYIPGVYLLFDKKFIDFYFAHWMFMSIPAIWYAIFRLSLFQHLRNQKTSRTFLKKSMKGLRNYWWYEQLNHETHLGWVYYMNKIFTITFATALGAQLFLGWWSLFSAFIVIVFVASCIPCSAMWLFASMQITQDEFGKRFTLWSSSIEGKTKRRHGYSSVLHLGGVILPLLVAYASIRLLLRL